MGDIDDGEEQEPYGAVLDVGGASCEPVPHGVDFLGVRVEPSMDRVEDDEHR